MTPPSEITSPNTFEKGLYTASFLGAVGFGALAIKQEPTTEDGKMFLALAAVSGIFGIGYYLFMGTSQEKTQNKTFVSKPVDTAAQDELAIIAKKVGEIHSLLETLKMFAALKPTDDESPQNTLASLELIGKYVEWATIQMAILESESKQFESQKSEISTLKNELMNLKISHGKTEIKLKQEAEIKLKQVEDEWRKQHLEASNSSDKFQKTSADNLKLIGKIRTTNMTQSSQIKTLRQQVEDLKKEIEGLTKVSQPKEI